MFLIFATCREVTYIFYIPFVQKAIISTKYLPFCYIQVAVHEGS